MNQHSSQDPHWPDETEAFAESVGVQPAFPAGAREWIFRVVPALHSLRTYTVRDLRRDALAGLTVATVAVPQAMAYATIAGIPPQYGLYTAIVMTAVALFSTPASS